MGLVIYPVFRKDISPGKRRTTGEFLASEFERLDAIAEEHGLTRLAAFGDQRNVPPEFDGPPEDLEELLGACDDWFLASTGKEALSKLAKLIRTDVGAARRLESPESLAEELEELSMILGIAADAGAEFRLEIG